MPTRIRGSVSRSIAFERDDDGVVRSVDHQMCGFVPLRDGIADDPRRIIPLTGDKAVRLQLNQEHTMDPAGLVGVFDRPRFEAWTGVTYEPMQSLEWLYLWLACVLDTGLCSMSVEQTVVDDGLVQPMFRSSTMAVPDHGVLAYLTWRLTGHTEDGGKIMEVGVIGHGDTAAELTDRVAEEVRTWSAHHRDRTVQFEIPPIGIDTSHPTVDRYGLDRPHHAITVIWQ